MFMCRASEEVRKARSRGRYVTIGGTECASGEKEGEKGETEIRSERT